MTHVISREGNAREGNAREGNARGGVMTLHDYGYLLPEFLKSYPVSERNFQIYTLPRSLAFFLGFFQGGSKSIVMQISFVTLIFFYCFQTNLFFFGGGIPGANCLREKPAVSRTMYQNTEMSCFPRKP